MRGYELLDRALASQALVYGSLPPEGRDVDLLVRPEDEAGAEAALVEAGFLCREGVWVRFAACTVEIVEVTSAAAWGLPRDELDALFEAARPLEGLSRLAQPSPQHAVLVLARRAARDGGRLDAKRQTRLAAVLDADPSAFDRAGMHAAGWGAQEALEQLRRGVAGGPPPARAPTRAPGRSRGAVIALSGLDGAGKSTQALALQQTLERLGYDATIAWTRIGWDDALWRFALPLKAALERALRLFRRNGAEAGDAVAAGAGPTGGAGERGDDPVKRIRESSALLTHVWTMVIAIINGLAQRRLTRSHVRRGGIVICDRYTLDSIVALRFAYGPHRRFRYQRAMIAALSPTPLRAYLIDVPPETAFARKGEGGLAWLAGHRRLYRQEHAGLGVRLLDGERPTEELCAEIGRDVWQSGR